MGYQYDARGNVKQRGSAGLGFDILNRLRTTPTGTYAYDAYGHRFNTVINGTSSYQVYSQEGKLYYGGVSGTVGSKYVYLDDRLLAEVRPNFIQSIHTDELGSPIATASYDPATRGQVLQRSRYEPYGKVAQYDTQTFGFTGHVNAADVGLVYMQQRYYDPIAARFLSIDPVVTDANTGGSFNRYVYANNSPYKYVDPDGRFAFLIPMAAGAVIGGGINFGAQLYRAGGDISRVSWGQVGVAAAGGALSGGAGVIAATASTILRMVGANAVAGASIGAVGAHAAAAVDGKSATTTEVVRAAALAGVASAAAGAITAVPASVAGANQLPGTAAQVGARNVVEGIHQTTVSSGAKVNYAQPAGQAAANRAGDIVSNSTNVEQKPKDR